MNQIVKVLANSTGKQIAYLQALCYGEFTSEFQYWKNA